MTFETYSGSIYEFDAANLQIRRVSGQGTPTARVGTDGDWKPCLGVYNISKDLCAVIHWRNAGDRAQCTVTSLIVRIYD